MKYRPLVTEAIMYTRKGEDHKTGALRLNLFALCIKPWDVTWAKLVEWHLKIFTYFKRHCQGHPCQLHLHLTKI